MAKLTDSVFLILKPNIHPNGTAKSFTVTGIRRTKPVGLRYEVALQLNLNIDSSFFEEYIPTIQANIESQRELIAPVLEIAEQTE